LNTTVPKGLDVGFYKLSSINTASNHQPLLVPIAQHGSLDDAIYFSVTSDGAAAGNSGKSAAHTAGVKSVALVSTTARAAVATQLSNSDNSQNLRLPASNAVLSSATASATSVPGAYDDIGLSSTLRASMKGKRELRSRFTLKF